MEQVCSFAFKDGRVFFRNRFVRSEAFIAEQQAQKMLYRGAFSVGNPSGGFFFNPFDFAVKGIANTSVLYWGGKLLALYEVCMALSDQRSCPVYILVSKFLHACILPVFVQPATVESLAVTVT